MDYRENLKRCNAINFWRAEYIKRKALQEIGIEKVSQIRNNINYLRETQDAKLGDDVVRYTLNAKYNQLHFNDSSYDISYLDKETNRFYDQMLKISLTYGYCADILMEEPLDCFELIQFIEEEKCLPYPPSPFYSPINPLIHIFIAFICMELDQCEFYSVGEKSKSDFLDQRAKKKHTDLVNEHERTFNQVEHKIDDEILYKKFFAYIKNNFKDRQVFKSTWSEKQKNDFIDTCKKIYSVKFNTDSSVTRAYGLYLWDNQFYNRSCSTAKAIKDLQKYIEYVAYEANENSEKKGTNDAIKASEEKCIDKIPIEPFFREKLANTIKCIEAGEVLSI